MSRVVFVLLDGLAAATARRCMSFMQSLTDAGLARHTELQGELPPLSRPIYATLLTGLRPAQSGIMHNDDARLCPAPTIFSRAQATGLTTAAAAYHWMSELCNVAPFEPGRDRITDNAALPIAHGLFYCTDAYPDDETFHDAACLRRRHEPHLLLAHSMGIDNAGHLHGANSKEYRDAARRADGLLARWLPEWTSAGYAVLVTSDHGMDDAAITTTAKPAGGFPCGWRAKGLKTPPCPQIKRRLQGLYAVRSALNNTLHLHKYHAAEHV